MFVNPNLLFLLIIIGYVFFFCSKIAIVFLYYCQYLYLKRAFKQIKTSRNFGKYVEKPLKIIISFVKHHAMQQSDGHQVRQLCLRLLWDSYLKYRIMKIIKNVAFTQSALDVIFLSTFPAVQGLH